MKKDWMIKESDIYEAQDGGQIELLNADFNRSYVVTGCAGSGKSVLALIKAQHIQQEQRDSFQIIVYTKALCNYMDYGRKELGIHGTFSYYDEWKWKRVPKQYADGSVYMVCARDNNGNKVPNEPLCCANYVIVDEIQNFTMQEIQEFVNATGKHFFFFGDPGQSVYPNKLPVQHIAKLFGQKEKIKEICLYNNYRLPLPVARLAQYFGVNLPPFDEDIYKSKETEMPYVLQYADLEAQVRAIYHQIRMDLTDVVILLPTKKMVEQIFKQLNNLGLSCEARYGLFDSLSFSTTKPKIMTYHSAQGLQFENVFMPAIESFRDDGGSYRKAFYVAMTRTYRRLYMMYSGDKLPTFWQQLNIPKELYKTSVIEEIDKI